MLALPKAPDTKKPAAKRERSLLSRFLGLFRRRPDGKLLASDGNLPAEDAPLLKDAEFSLCGHVFDSTPEEDRPRVFALYRIEPAPDHVQRLLSQPNTIIKIGGNYYDPETAEYILPTLIHEAEMDMDDLPLPPEAKARRVPSTPPPAKRRQLEETKRISPTVTAAKVQAVVSGGVEREKQRERVTAIVFNKEETAKEKGRKVSMRLVPTTEELKMLGISPGMNTVDFIIAGTNDYVSARIFVWDWSVRIIVSDIDGTITRSDFCGQVMPMLGKDWSHAGVAQLFTAIHRNGYEFVYLSSRSIALADTTRKYVTSLRQDGQFALPQGPIILSPDKIIKSLLREVVQRRPEVHPEPRKGRISRSPRCGSSSRCFRHIISPSTPPTAIVPTTPLPTRPSASPRSTYSLSTSRVSF